MDSYEVVYKRYNKTWKVYQWRILTNDFFNGVRKLTKSFDEIFKVVDIMKEDVKSFLVYERIK